MFCGNCGIKHTAEAEFCCQCGIPVQRVQATETFVHPQTAFVTSQAPIAVVPAVPDEGGFLWGLFGFALSLIILPFILFFTWKAQTPLRARSMLIGYLAGVVFWITLIVVTSIFWIPAFYDLLERMEQMAVILRV
ncbi:MAG: zinc ribbon domain-containing protein [Firmicutes bacterium]|nr:zinc ribbon domain-containing protein [Bacillota bacterium]